MGWPVGFQLDGCAIELEFSVCTEDITRNRASRRRQEIVVPIFNALDLGEMLACVLVRNDPCADRMEPLVGSGPRLDRVLVSCGRDTLIPPSTSTFPSEPVRTAILPPEPSSTLTFARSLYEVTGEDAALSLIRVTSPRGSAKACRGLSQPLVAGNAAPVMQQRQKWRRESNPMGVPLTRNLSWPPPLKRPPAFGVPGHRNFFTNRRFRFLCIGLFLGSRGELVAVVARLPA